MQRTRQPCIRAGSLVHPLASMRSTNFASAAAAARPLLFAVPLLSDTRSDVETLFKDSRHTVGNVGARTTCSVATASTDYRPHRPDDGDELDFDSEPAARRNREVGRDVDRLPVGAAVGEDGIAQVNQARKWPAGAKKAPDRVGSSRRVPGLHSESLQPRYGSRVRIDAVLPLAHHVARLDFLARSPAGFRPPAGWRAGCRRSCASSPQPIGRAAPCRPGFRSGRRYAARPARPPTIHMIRWVAFDNRLANRSTSVARP